MDDYVLELNHITKSFSRVIVVNDVTLKIKPGEVHALVGENGAGKSTLMKIIMGIYSQDSGEILVDGKNVHIRNPKEAIAYGISMIHQELNPIKDMEVAENVFVGREIRKWNLGGLSLVDLKEQRRITDELFSNLGISINPKSLMRNLSVAQIQLVEIVKSISLSSKVVIMDEPTSAITEKEVKTLFEQIDRLRKQNVAIIYISHKMDEIFKIADRISVLRDGNYIGTFEVNEIDNDKLIKMMVGREIKEFIPKTDAPIGEVVLEVNNLCRGKHFQNVSFKLHKGEILGIAGLVGAGRSELAECIFGITRPSSGEVIIRNKQTNIRHPKDAIRNRVALITEDRKFTGLNLKSTVKNNITIVGLDELSKLGVINESKERHVADKFIDQLKIKTNSRNTMISSLSGGNQQKVVLSKWLQTTPDIIIMDEPTRGIDVGAKRDIYLLMGELVKAGKALIMISSEIPEIMGLSDRILVLAAGRLTGEIHRPDFTQETIMRFASDFSSGNSI
jgi:ABC-type sugar transport system ATPase subunit